MKRTPKRIYSFLNSREPSSLHSATRFWAYTAVKILLWMALDGTTEELMDLLGVTKFEEERP